MKLCGPFVPWNPQQLSACTPLWVCIEIKCRHRAERASEVTISLRVCIETYSGGAFGSTSEVAVSLRGCIVTSMASITDGFNKFPSPNGCILRLQPRRWKQPEKKFPSLYGERRLRPHRFSRGCYFNPRSPYGCRHAVDQGTIISDFNLRCPRGCRHREFVFCLPLIDFNPRHPCGCRRMTRGNKKAGQKFQSTAPYG